MKIAVTSQNYQTITPHAGRTRRFLVYEVSEGGEPIEIDRLDMPKEMAMHDFHGDGPHPLDAMDLIIAGSFGEGFAARMAQRGITIVATDLIDPVAAVKEFMVRKSLGEEFGSGKGACGGHGHGHGHGHHHRHAHDHECESGHEHGHEHGHGHGGRGSGHRPGGGRMHGGFRILEGAPPAREVNDE
ncbi:MAG: nitrogen fixation protein [Defluviicoccus sp.]|nr:MAG: nitrogen fixation protein [Defluviicoccus sp.]